MGISAWWRGSSPARKAPLTLRHPLSLRSTVYIRCHAPDGDLVVGACGRLQDVRFYFMR